MFADDVSLYKPITSHSDLIAFQNDVDTIGQWSLLNHLSPNNNKTKFMVISRSKHYSQCPHILLAGIEFEQVSHFKYLGVWISADLTWSKYIMSVTCKARQLLGYIFRTFSPHCSPSAIMTLYRAQVLPILNYSCIIWDPHRQTLPI